MKTHLSRVTGLVNYTVKLRLKHIYYIHNNIDQYTSLDRKHCFI